VLDGSNLADSDPQRKRMIFYFAVKVAPAVEILSGFPEIL